MTNITQEYISIESQAAHLWNEYLHIADFSNDQPSKSDGDFWLNYIELVDFSQNHRIDLSADQAFLPKQLQRFAVKFRNKFQFFKELSSLFLLFARFFMLSFLGASLIMYFLNENLVQAWTSLIIPFSLVFAVIFGLVMLVTLFGLTIEWVQNSIKIENQGLHLNTKWIRWVDVQNIQLLNNGLTKMKVFTHDDQVFQFPINFRRKKYQRFVELLQKQVGSKLQVAAN